MICATDRARNDMQGLIRTYKLRWFLLFPTELHYYTSRRTKVPQVCAAISLLLLPPGVPIPVALPVCNQNGYKHPLTGHH